ncbi:MAG: DUF3010 family protein [Porticoccus sp.]|nr:DUF3010 family protein [Porticoccus sp.]MBQ0806411.1 DUF3010 family protein [Porticoccus sp.]
MSVCDVELKGNEAGIYSLGNSSQRYDVPDYRTQKLSLSDATDRYSSTSSLPSNS